MQPQLHLVRLDWIHNASRPWRSYSGCSFSLMCHHYTDFPGFNLKDADQFRTLIELQFERCGSISNLEKTLSHWRKTSTTPGCLHIPMEKLFWSIICYKIHDGGFTQCLCMSFEWWGISLCSHSFTWFDWIGCTMLRVHGCGPQQF